MLMGYQVEIFPQKMVLLPFPRRWIYSKDYIDADVKNKHLVFLRTRGRM